MSNPNQEIIESRLASYIDGELDANERLEIEQHLQQNPQYRRLIDDLRKQRDMLRGLPREAAPLELAEAFTGQLERSVLLETRTEKSGQRMRIYALPRIAAAAAIVLLTLGLAAIVFYVLPNSAAKKLTLADGATRSPVRAPTTQDDEGMAQEKNAEKIPAGVNEKGGRSEVEAAENAQRKELQKVAQSAVVDSKLESLAEKGGAAPAAAAPPAVLRQASRAAYDSHDEQLDQLARKISNEPGVKELLAGVGNDKLAAGAALPGSQNTRVLVVRPGIDAGKLESDLASFFRRDNITWRSAPPRVELALNTSLLRQDDEALESGQPANTRQINAAAVAPRSDRDAKYPKSAPDSDGALGVDRMADLERGNSNDATDGIVSRPAGRDTAKASFGATEPSASAPRPMDRMVTSLTARPVQVASGSGRQRRQTLPANADAVENMYVVRHLSPVQLEELNVYLSQIGAESTPRPLGEYRYGGEDLATEKRSAVDARIFPTTVPSSLADGAPGVSKDDAAGFANQEAQTPPVAAAPAGAGADGPLAGASRRLNQTVQRGAIMAGPATTRAPIEFIPVTQPSDGGVDVVIVVQKPASALAAISAPPYVPAKPAGAVPASAPALPATRPVGK